MLRQTTFFVLLTVTAHCLSALPSAAQTQQQGWEPRPDVVERSNAKRKGQYNFFENKVPSYTLPDPLELTDGKRIKTADAWQDVGRPKTLNIFREHVYGIRPDTTYNIEYQLVGQEDNAFGIGATVKQIRATVFAKDKWKTFDFVIATPKANKTVGLIVLIHNRRFVPLDKAVGKPEGFWPVQEILERGYATATFHTSHVDPDKANGYAQGIRALLDDPNSAPETRWKSLSAWGWAASRILDYAHDLPGIDPQRTAVVGHSRGGKAALWAGAEDTRFNLVYSNNSGCGGAALSRRAFGETTERINRKFSHWFCTQFSKYDHKENEMPIDQHQLIGLIAPRGVYVTSADEDLWADPRGEYEALVAAGPVYALLGKDHIKAKAVPPLNTPQHIGATGYHIRTGKHDLTRKDWGYFLNFADQFFAGQ